MDKTTVDQIVNLSVYPICDAVIIVIIMYCTKSCLPVIGSQYSENQWPCLVIACMALLFTYVIKIVYISIYENFALGQLPMP